MEKMDEFYSHYPLSLWKMKYFWLKNLFENKQKGVDIILPNQKALFSKFEYTFEEMVNIDIHVLQFHVIEALFSLVFALEEGNNDFVWFNLSFSKDLGKNRLAVYEKISKLRKVFSIPHYLNEKITIDSKIIPFWQFLFYFNQDLTTMDKTETDILEPISDYLTRLASIFTDREDFNAYKHGLRLYSTRDMKVGYGHESSYGVPSGPIFAMHHAKYGINFLSKKQSKEGNNIVYKKFKAFSPREDLFYINIALKLMGNIIELRNSELQDVKPHFFTKYEYFMQDDYNIFEFSRGVTSDLKLYQSGVKSFRSKLYEEAIFYAKKSLQLTPNLQEAIMLLGYSYIRLNNSGEALVHFKEYLKKDTNTSYKRVCKDVMSIYYTNNEFKNCISLYHKKINKNNLINEFSADDKEKIKILLIKANLNLNEQYFKKNGKNKKQWIYTSKSVLEEIDSEVKNRLDLWFQIALLLNQLNKPKEAKKIYLRIHDKDPLDGSTLINLGRIFAIEGDIEKAESYFQQSIDSQPEYENTWINYADFLWEIKKDLPRALEYLKNAFPINKNPRILIKQFFILKELGTEPKKHDLTSSSKSTKIHLRSSKI